MADPDEPSSLPPDVSALRFMMAHAHGVPHVRFDTLDAARHNPDAVAVMEGDYGGQIYLTCPVRLVRCAAQALQQLLSDLDALQWNDPDGAGLFYEVAVPGSGVAGGMGGGGIVDGVWIHERLEHLRPQIELVIAGTRARVA